MPTLVDVKILTNAPTSRAIMQTRIAAKIKIQDIHAIVNQDLKVSIVIMILMNVPVLRVVVRLRA